MVYGEMLSLDDILSRVSAVTLDDIRDVAAALLVVEPSLAVIGPFERDQDFSGAVAS